MPEQTRIVMPGREERTVRTAEGQVLVAPADWVLVRPGDAALTRRVKAAGPTWTVQEKKGRKIFSLGVWARGAVVETIRKELLVERAAPAYTRRREADARRREREQAEYVQVFQQAVLAFLNFDARYAALAARLADAVTAHATPVGSGTVARTERIPVEQRAEAAVIAWMRHRTTAYDSMVIPRIKGKRRETRRLLAGKSKMLLEGYRTGREIDPGTCPLWRALTEPGR
ncbi:MAG TPA: DUF2293 domain-containing protein [Tepidisphaeraceae bacterium]|nr:DUF2293 domain-containing protein [Tepidisphaeraceae bacterium]